MSKMSRRCKKTVNYSSILCQTNLDDDDIDFIGRKRQKLNTEKKQKKRESNILNDPSVQKEKAIKKEFIINEKTSEIMRMKIIPIDDEDDFDISKYGENSREFEEHILSSLNDDHSPTKPVDVDIKNDSSGENASQISPENLDKKYTALKSESSPKSNSYKPIDKPDYHQIASKSSISTQYKATANVSERLRSVSTCKWTPPGESSAYQPSVQPDSEIEDTSIEESHQFDLSSGSFQLTSSFSSRANHFHISNEQVDFKCPTHVKRPNYFVAFPIIETEVWIRGQLSLLQEEILKIDHKLKETLVAVENAHLTIMVMHLDEDHCLHDARTALKMAIEIIRKDGILLEAPILEFEGLSTFKREVLFTGPRRCERLSQMTEIVRNCFARFHILSSDKKAFNPHLTVAKMSKAPFKMQKHFKYKFPKACLAIRQGVVFGKTELKTIQICSMLKSKSEDGYYHVSERLSLIE